MSGTSGVFNTVQSPDQIFNLLYTTGYRLTGSHRLTAELIEVSISALNQQGQKSQNKLLNGVSPLLKGSKNIGVSAMLKSLCTSFINKTTVVCGRDHAAAPLTRLQMQEALLCLPPMERLLVVLRDILGLTYAEIADLTGLEKSGVASLLSAGRWSLRELFAVPKSPSNLSKRARVAE